jgi:hypothetical protein
MNANQSAPAKENDATTQDNILAQIGVGTMLIFYWADNEYLLSMVGSPNAHYPVAVVTPAQSSSNFEFIITAYEWDGAYQAKASIQCQTIPGLYLTPIVNADGLQNAFVLGPTQDTIILNALPKNPGLITFATSYSPPPSQTRLGHNLGYNYLEFGFDRPVMATFQPMVIG